MLQMTGKTRMNQEPIALKERPDIEPLAAVDPAVYSDEAKKYFAHYGLDGYGLDTQHWFGSFESAGFTLAAHLYKPVEYTATVVLHGLSSGETARIDSFDQYITVTHDFIRIVKDRLSGPYHTVGFSTGATILVEMLQENITDDFEKIVLAAPLIHWTAYEQSKATYKLYSSFTDRVARFHRKNSSDKDFLAFNKKKDYLHARELSLKWVKALFEWNDKIEPMAPCGREVLVIQGDNDGSVDWKYNLKLMGEKFPNAKIKMISGANHELFNEAMEYKQQALNYIAEYFGQNVKI
jgi:alpha-beta hydrolase superfamily lysophospholipase